MTAEAINNLDCNTATGTSNVNTANISPDSRKVIFLAVGSFFNSGSPIPNVPTPSLSGWVFEEVATVTFGPFSNNNRRLTLFVATGRGGGVINLDFGGQTQDRIDWSVDQITNCKQGNHGLDAIRQPTTFGPHASGFNISLSPFANINNGCYACTAKDAVNTIVPTAPLVISNQVEPNSPNFGLGSMFSPTNDTNPKATFAGSGGDATGAIACEVVFQPRAGVQVI